MSGRTPFAPIDTCVQIFQPGRVPWLRSSKLSPRFRPTPIPFCFSFYGLLCLPRSSSFFLSPPPQGSSNHTNIPNRLLSIVFGFIKYGFLPMRPLYMTVAPDARPSTFVSPLTLTSTLVRMCFLLWGLTRPVVFCRSFLVNDNFSPVPPPPSPIGRTSPCPVGLGGEGRALAQIRFVAFARKSVPCPPAKAFSARLSLSSFCSLVAWQPRCASPWFVVFYRVMPGRLDDSRDNPVLALFALRSFFGV